MEDLILDYKVILGLIAAVIAPISFVPYIRDIFKGKTKPHVFSWFIWSALTGTAFVGQLVSGGGAGAWVTGMASLGSFYIFLLSFRSGERTITTGDFISFTGAIVALFTWYLTKDPLAAIILITTIDVLGYVPTFRKSFNKPFEETLRTYALSALKFFISLFALQLISIETALYPASLVITNLIFVAMVHSRRRALTDDSEYIKYGKS